MPRLDSVWHYTTADGLRSIVEGGVLWATSHRFMNDSEESSFATKTLQAAADEVRKGVSDEVRARFDDLMKAAERRHLEAFLLCAASEPNLLTVWRGYGSAVPYAIELDSRVDLFPVEQVRGDSHPHPPKGWQPEIIDYDEEGRPIMGPDPDGVRVEKQMWGRVEYDDTLARGRVNSIKALAMNAPHVVADALLPWGTLGQIDLLQLKHPAFIDEREARTVFEVFPRWKFVKYRTSRFGLTPYIEVSPADGTNMYAATDPFVHRPAAKLPIRSVHIGPSPLGEESVSALSEFLEFNGYPDVQIVKSTIPFR